MLIFSSSFVFPLLLESIDADITVPGLALLFLAIEL